MRFKCPHCRQNLEGHKSISGRNFDCPKCGVNFTIPTIGKHGTIPVHPSRSTKREEQAATDSKYTFQKQIAKGGMGKIISAVDPDLERPVVIKQLLDPNQDAALVNQLIREAQITARLSHPGIVPIHELNRDSQDRIYYTMKHIRGESLESVLNKLREEDPVMIEKSPFQRLLLIFSRVCDAIGYANDQGIVHRDIKPDNVMLASYGEYLVIDWGIAKDLNQKDDSADEVISSAFRYEPEKGDYGATLHGAIFGSPSYMSPEQARGEVESIDARSDVFSLGALLFELLTLSPPFEGVTPEDAVESAAKRDIKLISEIRSERPDPRHPWPHLEGGELPESVLAVAMKAMQMNPDDRYQSASELRRDIDAYLSGHTTVAEKAGLVKIVRLAISRHQKLATALAASLCLASSAIVLMANANSKETLKAQQARAEAESFISRTALARDERQSTRLDVAPKYVEMARLLANRGEVDDALVLARLAAEFDADLLEARALVKALEIDNYIKTGEGTIVSAEVGNCPSLAYLLEHPEVLIANPGIETSEQVLTRLALAYSEVGLSRFAGKLTAEQTQRLSRYTQTLIAEWEGLDLVWELSLAKELSSLCVTDEIHQMFPDYASWAAKIDREYPGQILHLDIRSGRSLPDLTVLTKLAVESVNFGKGVEISPTQMKELTTCRSLKVVSFESSNIENLSFLEGLPLVSLKINSKATTLDVSPLRECNSLRVIVSGRCKLSSLESLPGESLNIFSGCVDGGDYSVLSGMPLRFLRVDGETASTHFGPEMKSLPVQSLIMEGGNLTRDWETVSNWPLKFLSVDSTNDIDVGPLKPPLNQLSHLHIRGGLWIGDVDLVFPVLESMVDADGNNFECFARIRSMATIQIEGESSSICYASAFGNVPPEIDCQISPDVPVQVLPAAVALNMVAGNWSAAALSKIEASKSRQRSLPPSFIAQEMKLDQAIADQDDSEEVFISRKHQFNESKYQLVLCGLTHEKAAEFAVEAGGKLVEIDSKEEQAFVSELALNYPEFRAFWIGEASGVIAGDDEDKPALQADGYDSLMRPACCVYPFVIEWHK